MVEEQVDSALLEVLVEAGGLDAHVVLANLALLAGDHSLVAPLEGLATQRLAGVLLPADLGGLQVLQTHGRLMVGRPYGSLLTAAGRRRCLAVLLADL